MIKLFLSAIDSVMFFSLFYRRVVSVTNAKKESNLRMLVYSVREIAEFYDTLVQDSIDALEFRPFRAQFGIDISDDVLKKYEQGINSLRARAALARS